MSFLCFKGQDIGLDWRMLSNFNGKNKAFIKLGTETNLII